MIVRLLADDRRTRRRRRHCVGAGAVTHPKRAAFLPDPAIVFGRGPPCSPAAAGAPAKSGVAATASGRGGTTTSHADRWPASLAARDYGTFVYSQNPNVRSPIFA